MEQKLIEYKKSGFLDIKTVDGREIFHLTTPCRFRVTENIVCDLKKNYKADEQIGGVLWAKPTFKDGEIINSINKVSYIRNAIEDNTRADDRNKSNAYLSDFKELNKALNDLFLKGYLPVKFHTHQNLTSVSSKQDKRESTLPFIVGNKKLLMPQGRIVGNDVFIEVYNSIDLIENYSLQLEVDLFDSTEIPK
jgi:hypothetical protein